MFVINDLPPPIAADLTGLLQQAEPATIGHFLDFGFVDPAIRALWQVPRIAGTAVTVRCAGTDSTIVHYALGQVRPGDVEYAVPVWARALSAVTTKRLFQQGEFCTPVAIGGVAVHPGDAILADENGILVLHPSVIAEAANRAIRMQADEGPRLAEVAKGAKLPELNGTNARLREILAAQKRGAGA
jgi:regulator of RNase E activity RraA